MVVSKLTPTGHFHHNFDTNTKSLESLYIQGFCVTAGFICDKTDRKMRFGYTAALFFFASPAPYMNTIPYRNTVAKNIRVLMHPFSIQINKGKG